MVFQRRGAVHPLIFTKLQAFLCMTKVFVLHNAYVIFFMLMVGECFIKDRGSSNLFWKEGKVLELT